MLVFAKSADMALHALIVGRVAPYSADFYALEQRRVARFIQR